MQLADFDNARNLVSLFLDRADALGEEPMLWRKQDGAWRSLSWAEAARQVCLISESLLSMGLKPGDRVILVSENRPEWCLADLAIMAAGCITVPAYTTNTERDHTHILANSGARAVIVSTAALSRNVIPAVARNDNCEFVIHMEPLTLAQAGNFSWHGWASLLTGDATNAREKVASRMQLVNRSDIACIIYTSGTGGAPRGVPQHHGAILSNISGAAHIIAEDFGWDREIFLSFLPLSHAYEHTGGQFLPIGLGAQIYYAEGLEKLASNIEEVRPTIMIVVPRLFELLRTRIMKQIEKQGRVPKMLMDQAVAVARRRQDGHARIADWPTDFLASKLLKPKIRDKFGGRIKAMVSGGAPLNPEVGTFFEAMGMTLLQGYGQTEAAPIISCNRPRSGVKMDTVGPPMRGVEVRIAEDGEILIRGELVMHGYWANEAETARALQDSWLYTGDIGHLDSKGRIVITDRKKDMIVNDKGDNVSPLKIQSMLTLQPEIAQAMVVGDRRPYLVALVVPDPDWAKEWAADNNVSNDLLHVQENPSFRAAVRGAIDRVNAQLSVIEKVRQFDFADEAFTIENEEMTPSLKIRRHKLVERYGERLDRLYHS